MQAMAEHTRMANGVARHRTTAQRICPARSSLAQELRRASDHKAGDEHCEDGEADHAVQAAAHAAEHHLAQRYLEHLDNPPSGV